MGEHTPTPWAVDYLDKHGQRVVRSEHIEVCTCWHHCVGAIEKEMEANAALIVKAVNSHQALVDALRDVLSMLDQNNTAPGKFLYSQERIAKARAALALAGEKI